MRVVLQKVLRASCTVDNKVTGSINEGYMLLVGFTHSDTLDNVAKMAYKIANARVYPDEAGKINKSIYDCGGSILSISQFTLYADTRKGHRPSFTEAMPGDLAVGLYKAFNEELRKTYKLSVEEGIFGADMKIELINDGPTTIIYEV